MDRSNQTTRRSIGQISLLSIFIFTIVFAVLSLSLGFLYRAVDQQGNSMGQFILITAMSPLLTLAVVSTLLRLGRKKS